MKRDCLSLVGVSVTQDAKSPFWVAQWSLSNGARVKRSTKVPVEGGLFQGERLSKVQARKRALLVAQELAAAAQVEAERVDNLSVRELFDTVLKGKLGRLSVATYANARTTYAQFCEWLGKRRAQEPARLVTRADIKQWVTDRRAEVRCKTVQHGLYVLRAAFNWALDAELIARNPCDRVSVPPDGKEERVVHEAFSQEEVQVLVEKLPDEWAAAVRCCLGTFGQRLGDIRTLRWDQFDWERRVVNMTTGKTGRRLQQPMLAGFYEWARARYEWAQGLGGDAAVWVLPRGLHLLRGNIGLLGGVALQAVGACVGGFAVSKALCASLCGLLCGVGGGGGAVDELTHFEVRITRYELSGFESALRAAFYAETGELRVYSSGGWSLES